METAQSLQEMFCICRLKHSSVEHTFSGHGVNNGKQENQRGGDEPDINAYYTDPDAANVLAMLESEMTESDDPVLQIQHLRSLLEAECKAQVSDLETYLLDSKNHHLVPQLLLDPFKSCGVLQL